MAPPAETTRAEHVERTPFGAALWVDRHRLANGLEVLICEDRSAPVVAYQTWFRVGSRHERPGKTGLAHLFEHLMFNEAEDLAAGEYDRRLEEAGADTNASTWLDWTQYTVAAPREALDLVIELEARRMGHLVLRDELVKSELEVVANERRYRVDDDVEGAASELLWATAFQQHAYRWPTIGWMADILGFTTDDVRRFYAAHYPPNNARIVVAGDVEPARLLQRIGAAYGGLSARAVPSEDVRPEPPQTAERRVEVTKPTQTDKLLVGYRAPAIADADHPALAVLAEVLFGGRASRVVRELVHDRELASEARAFVPPFVHPGLLELWISARDGVSAEDLLAALDAQIARVVAEPPGDAELERARARLELGFASGLETAEGKASTIGFYDAVMGRPAAAFERFEATASVGPADVLRAARRYLERSARTVVMVRPGTEAP